MSDLIQWPKAVYWTKTFNPVIGCKPCSPACDNCYAAAWARRFNVSFRPHASKQKRPPRSGVCFCGNLTDLFGGWRTKADMFLDVDSVMRVKNPTGYYLWLTKRVRSMCDVLHTFTIRPHKAELLFNNQYFGFTAENQEWFDRRRDEIYHNAPSWANLWLSCEPLIGEIDSLYLGNFAAGHRLKWLVVGCESGTKRRPCKLEWVESIVEQCLAANVPVFVKQLDINGCCVTDINKFPAHLRIRQVPWATKGGAA